jgi:hypothetical protein
VLTTLIGARTGAAVAGVAIGLAATSFVAYSATRQAQTTTLTPASASAAPTPTSSSSPVGPDATGPAAHGLCTAWANHHKHQDGVQRAQDSEAMRNLARAAGGESKVAAYCAKLPTHRNGPKSDRDDAADDSSKGKPTTAGPKAKPTPAGPKAKPTTKPTPRPSASGSASVPAPSGSTSPTASPTASASPSAQP